MTDRSNQDQRDWDGAERRTSPVFSESDIELIAEKAANKAVEKLTGHIYKEIGRGVVAKLFWIVGALATGLYLWLSAKGLIK